MLIYNNTIVAKGHNKYLRNGHIYFDSTGNNLRTIHAEMDVITKCPKKYLSSAILIVVRLPTSLCLKELGKKRITIKDCSSSEPCPKCSRLIIKSKIPIVFFS